MLPGNQPPVPKASCAATPAGTGSRRLSGLPVSPADLALESDVGDCSDRTVELAFGRGGSVGTRTAIVAGVGALADKSAQPVMSTIIPRNISGTCGQSITLSWICWEIAPRVLRDVLLQLAVIL